MYGYEVTVTENNEVVIEEKKMKYATDEERKAAIWKSKTISIDDFKIWTFRLLQYLDAINLMTQLQTEKEDGDDDESMIP